MRHARRNHGRASQKRASESAGVLCWPVFLGDEARFYEDCTMSHVIPLDYHGLSVRFSTDGWINATDIAKEFGKEPTQWLRQASTVEYLVKLADHLKLNSVRQTELQEFKALQSGSSTSKTRALKLAKTTGLVRIAPGRDGGTWLHPKMAVRFARWLSVDFEIWCDMQIDRLLRGRRKLDAAIEAVDRQRERGSHAGSELARHRYKMPALENHRDGLFEQMRLPLEVSA